MSSNEWHIKRVKGGFIVTANSSIEAATDGSIVGYSRPNEMVFPDPSSLLNFLHNELVGSN